MHLFNNTFSTTSCKNCVCVIKQILISNIKLTLDLERLDRLNDFLLVTLHARKRDLQIALILSHKFFFITNFFYHYSVYFNIQKEEVREKKSAKKVSKEVNRRRLIFSWMRGRNLNWEIQSVILQKKMFYLWRFD